MGGLGGAMVDIVTPDCLSLAQSFDERQGVMDQYVTARFQKFQMKISFGMCIANKSDL